MKKTLIFSFLFTVLAFCSQSMAKPIFTKSIGDFQFVKTIKESDVYDSAGLFADKSAIISEYGIVHFIMEEFSKGDGIFTAEIVELDSQKDALGVYRILKLPDSKEIELGYSGIKTETFVQFVKGEYLFTVKPSSKDRLADAEALAGSLAGIFRKIAFKPDLSDRLPKSGIIENTVTYFKGRNSFNYYFPGNLGDQLIVGNCSEGYSAKYSVDGCEIDFFRIKFKDRTKTTESVNSYIDANKDKPQIEPGEILPMYTIINDDKSEDYISEYGEWLYFMKDNRCGKKGQELFLYFLRGGK